MSALHLLLPFSYLMAIIALSQVPPRMLEQASEAAAVAKNKNDALFSSLDSKSPPSPLLSELRQRAYSPEASIFKESI